MTLVTIGVPTRNRAILLRRTLTSLVGQLPVGDLEVIVSDNASTDETPSVIQEFSRILPIRETRQETLLPAIENFEIVRAKAKGKYFQWLADDDWFSPGALGRLTHALDTNPHAALAVPAVRYFSGDVPLEPRNVDLVRDFIDDSPALRAFKFLRHVERNSEFYGLRRVALTHEIRRHDFLGSDWLEVASIAAAGHIVAVREATLNRSVGPSANVPELARSYGLSRFWMSHPHLYTGQRIGREIAAGIGPFRALPPPIRILLAMASTSAIWWRCTFSQALKRLKSRLLTS